jgi:hypothetical protein
VPQHHWTPNRIASDLEVRLERAGAKAAHHLQEYVRLLRSADGADNGDPRAYLLKLELPDGRWDITEVRFDHDPAVGTSVGIEGMGSWVINGRTQVNPRPGTKPAREILVCQPAL